MKATDIITTTVLTKKMIIFWLIGLFLVIIPFRSGADDLKNSPEVVPVYKNLDSLDNLSQTKISTRPNLPPIKYNIT
ncbi:MAG TPA: hypothetical protein VNJ29_04125, partial [Candidatus Nitrosotenuis sp.]|nr:hypothetical protein [Candidatus Nitrosotenuis sp.]